MLYIEDNPDNIFLMECFVDNLPNWTLVIAKTAEIGLNLAQSCAPHLIICDINLPGMNGIQVVEKLRSMHDMDRDFPIYAISADATSQTISDAMAAGFTKYLTKPIRLSVLKAEIDSLFQA